MHATLEKDTALLISATLETIANPSRAGMKLAATLIGLSFATLGAAQAALCEVMCFNEVMNHPDAATCEEPDMYYCFCRVPSLSQAYRNCACRTCPSVLNQVIDDGLDLCEELDSPIVNFDRTCP
ncbi:unnamed protein product [Parascedosporium putredinis]|uniref:Extracellular membrane protein CFEM domain-containing protein n=1 Tax=Parascedosporium putredinis TaxID=1442378 RepID=A0A9P1H4X1_9PEZI|nr:unnamed protein product [Parascedosporium putredinis]CAI7997341.1 unnamed protein product [Parascedosporium putredinis]